MIALVGAGPLGIEMAVALRRNGLPYVHFEAGQIGGTIAWWAPGTRWFSSNDRISIAGVPLVTPSQEKASREEYLAYLRSVVQQFNLPIQNYTQVTHIQKSSDGFVLSSRHALHALPEQLHNVSQIILATGGTASPNLLNIPGEEMPHVSHYFRDPHAYFGKKLLIVGGRNSAVEAALRCHRAGAQVHFSYHGANVDSTHIKYWLYPEFTGLIKAGNITPHFSTAVQAITPTHALLKSTQDGSLKTYDFDFILLLTGYKADMSLAKSAGVTLTGDQEIPSFNPDTMETNVPGIYIAGTAIAGTQRGYKIFLENCHTHVDRILAHLTGKKSVAPATLPPEFDRPES